MGSGRHRIDSGGIYGGSTGRDPGTRGGGGSTVRENVLCRCLALRAARVLTAVSVIRLLGRSSTGD
jgi:hypothetical protein